VAFGPKRFFNSSANYTLRLGGLFEHIGADEQANSVTFAKQLVGIVDNTIAFMRYVRKVGIVLDVGITSFSEPVG